jgi:hypothetical protein
MRIFLLIAACIAAAPVLGGETKSSTARMDGSRLVNLTADEELTMYD